MSYRILFLIFFLSLNLILPFKIDEYQLPVYRVVIDPGHGGISMNPRSSHGDRYDLISKRYLASFREGASYKDVTEHAIMYEIARKVHSLLLEFSGDRKTGPLYRKLKKYHRGEPSRIKIIPILSRGDSRNRSEIRKREDPNSEFRIFDFPDKDGVIQQGRISKINAFKPHLVVSLHCDYRAPIDRRGINPVILPPPWLLFEGLKYLQGESTDRSFFWNSPYTMWFIEDTKRSAFQWFLNDTSLLYTGYRVDRNNKINLDSFKGYRHNMVHWAYGDKKGWEKEAWKHLDHTPYSKDYKTLKMDSPFWKRELHFGEQFRRGGGPEGYGGDNLYASREIIRYMITALEENGFDHREQKVGAPYISTWALPMYTNAICAYIELGYLQQERFRKIFTENQDEIAEGIALGIYSLLAGMDLKDNQWKAEPRGKKIDFDKYKISNEETYFDVVSP